jgi:hypothetical protein
MNLLSRSRRAALAAAALTLSLAGPAFSQPETRTPCDLLPDRLQEIQAEQAQVRSDYETVSSTGESADLSAIVDRMDTLLGETGRLLARIDECSRSPVPSLAD